MHISQWETDRTYRHWLHQVPVHKLRALYWLHQQLGIGANSPWHSSLLWVAKRRHLGELGIWDEAIGLEWLSSFGYGACQGSAAHLDTCLYSSNQVIRAARRLLQACFRQLEPGQPNYGITPFEVMETSSISGVTFSSYGGTQWLNICICQLLLQRAAEGNMVPRPTTVAN